MLFMLLDTPDARYRGGPDPAEERERRWEPVSRRERTEMEAAHLGAAGGAFVAPLPEWHFARRFLGPDDLSMSRTAFGGFPGSMSQLPEHHYLKRLAS